MDTSKLIVPGSIVVGCAILGGVYYASEINKQESIERQQAAEIREKAAEREAEEERQEKEYIASQKANCLNIYQTEQDEWSNVTGWDYNEVTDTCYVTYKEQYPKDKEQCMDSWSLVSGQEPNIFGDNSLFYHEYSLCMEGRFRNSF